jgi:hypothetical protein
MNRLAGNPALLFLVDQEPWLCGAASRRLCPSMLAVYCNVRTFGSKDKARCIRATAIQHIAGGATRIAGGGEQEGVCPSTVAVGRKLRATGAEDKIWRQVFPVSSPSHSLDRRKSLYSRASGVPGSGL